MATFSISLINKQHCYYIQFRNEFNRILVFILPVGMKMLFYIRELV
jgi:hypothetical protein